MDLRTPGHTPPRSQDSPYTMHPLESQDMAPTRSRGQGVWWSLTTVAVLLHMAPLHTAVSLTAQSGTEQVKGVSVDHAAFTDEATVTSDTCPDKILNGTCFMEGGLVTALATVTDFGACCALCHGAYHDECTGQYLAVLVSVLPLPLCWQCASAWCASAARHNEIVECVVRSVHV